MYKTFNYDIDDINRFLNSLNVEDKVPYLIWLKEQFIKLSNSEIMRFGYDLLYYDYLHTEKFIKVNDIKGKISNLNMLIDHFEALLNAEIIKSKGYTTLKVGKTILRGLKDTEKNKLNKFLSDRNITIRDIAELDYLELFIKTLQDELKSITFSIVSNSLLNYFEKRDRKKLETEDERKKNEKKKKEIKKIKIEENLLREIIKLLTDKIKPNVILYNTTIIDNNTLIKDKSDSNNLPIEFKEDIKAIRNKIEPLFINNVPEQKQIAIIIEDQFETIKIENRNKYQNKLYKNSTKLYKNKFFIIAVNYIAELGEGKFTANKLYKSLTK